MGFLGKLLSATVKTAVTPLAVLKDISEAGENNTTGEILDSALEDLGDSLEDLKDGNLI